VAGCGALTDSARSYASPEESVWFALAPRLYYVVVDGRGQNAGRFDLELRQADTYPVPVSCFWGPSLRCLENSEPACAESRASPACLSAALECGLDPAVYAAFCARFAGCCEGTAPPEDCRAAWSANLECL
jgi:hypothetical protein